MAFKMKNPSMGKMVKAAGDSRAAAKMKSEESPMKMGKKSPMEKDKDFGVEGSAMKFKKIGSKIKDKLAERKAKRNKSATAEDPDAKGKKQNVAETGIVKDTKRSKGTRSGEKIKEFQVGVKMKETQDEIDNNNIGIPISNKKDENIEDEEDESN